MGLASSDGGKLWLIGLLEDDREFREVALAIVIDSVIMLIVYFCVRMGRRSDRPKVSQDDIKMGELASVISFHLLF